MPDWKIHKTELACVRCQRPFEVGEATYSVLTFGDEGLDREDHCGSCFRQRSGEDRAGLERLVWWRTRRPADARRGMALDFEAVEGLFLALEGREEERLRELRYLLSLLLMRKRRVKLVRVRRRPTGEIMVVRRPRRSEEIEVEVFDLTPERSEALRHELERIVEGADADEVLSQAASVPRAGDDPDAAGAGHDAGAEGGEVAPGVLHGEESKSG